MATAFSAPFAQSLRDAIARATTSEKKFAVSTNWLLAPAGSWSSWKEVFQIYNLSKPSKLSLRIRSVTSPAAPFFFQISVNGKSRQYPGPGRVSVELPANQTISVKLRAKSAGPSMELLVSA